MEFWSLKLTNNCSEINLQLFDSFGDNFINLKLGMTVLSLCTWESLLVRAELRKQIFHIYKTRKHNSSGLNVSFSFPLEVWACVLGCWLYSAVFWLDSLKIREDRFAGLFVPDKTFKGLKELNVFTVMPFPVRDWTFMKWWSSVDDFDA